MLPCFLCSAILSLLPMSDPAYQVISAPNGIQPRYTRSVAIDGKLALAVVQDARTRRHSILALRLEGSKWVHDGVLVPDDDPELGSNEAFGLRVALSGNRAFITADRYEQDGPNAPTALSGGVFVFLREGGRWEHETTIRAPIGVPEKHFGTSLSAEGETLVIGSEVADAASLMTGAAYVYKLQKDGHWGVSHKIQPPSGDYTDRFGASVAIKGDLVWVTAPRTDHAGRLYAFRLDHDQARMVVSIPAPAGVTMLGDVIAAAGDQVFASGVLAGGAQKRSAVYRAKVDGSVEQLRDTDETGMLKPCLACDEKQLAVCDLGAMIDPQIPGMLRVCDVTAGCVYKPVRLAHHDSTPGASIIVLGDDIQLSNGWVIVGAHANNTSTIALMIPIPAQSP